MIPINSLSGIDELMQLLATRIYIDPLKMKCIESILSRFETYRVGVTPIDAIFNTGYEDLNIIIDCILDIITQHAIYEDKNICDLFELLHHSIEPSQSFEQKILCFVNTIKSWFDNDTHLCNTIFTFADIHDLV